jgi:divalent metal cation (Fe/Co/Zn/Cd) transporter
MELKEVHGICDQIEEEIRNKISSIEIQIHVEPVN